MLWAAALITLVVVGAAVVFGISRISVGGRYVATGDLDPPAPSPVERVRRIPTAVLCGLAEPLELMAAADRTERVAHLIEVLEQTPPVVVHVDGRGRVCLADGHHRTVAALRCGKRALKVVFREVEQIRGFSRPAIWVLDENAKRMR